MKKIVLLLIAALLLCAFAAAETVETPDYALTLPEGFGGGVGGGDGRLPRGVRARRGRPL